jgi:hypothetical protein
MASTVVTTRIATGRSHIVSTFLRVSAPSEPFWSDQRREQVDEQEGGHAGGEVDHDAASSDLLARAQEHEAESHAREAQQEHGRQPYDEIHRDPPDDWSRVAAGRVRVMSVWTDGNDERTPISGSHEACQTDARRHLSERACAGRRSAVATDLASLVGHLLVMIVWAADAHGFIKQVL